MTTNIANNISVPLKTALFCLNLELITSQDGVDNSIIYEIVNSIKKKQKTKTKTKKTIKKNTKLKKNGFLTSLTHDKILDFSRKCLSRFNFSINLRYFCSVLKNARCVVINNNQSVKATTIVVHFCSILSIKMSFIYQYIMLVLSTIILLDFCQKANGKLCMLNIYLNIISP